MEVVKVLVGRVSICIGGRFGPSRACAENDLSGGERSYSVA